MVIRCPSCKTSLEYDDEAFHHDDEITDGSSCRWRCDRCDQLYDVTITMKRVDPKWKPLEGDAENGN